MNAALKKSFDKYLAVASDKFAHRGGLKRPKGALTLILSEAEELRSIVKKAEESHWFDDLITKASERFVGQYYDMSMYLQITQSGVATHFSPTEDYKRAIQNFFRRSGIYHDLYAGKSVQPENWFGTFVSAFETGQFDTILLAPIHNTFFTKQSMDFGGFSISKFEVSDLKRLLNTHITSVFYSDRMVDPELLKRFWFVHVRCPSSIREVLAEFDYDMPDNRIRFKYPASHLKLYPAFSAMSLYDWPLTGKTGAEVIQWMVQLWAGTDSVTKNEARKIEAKSLGALENRFMRFEIPFLIEARNDFIGFPSRGFDVDKEKLVGLNLAQQCDSEIDFTYAFDERLTHHFESFVRKTREAIIALREEGSKWAFLERALQYHLKGVFAEGLEALLWHIVALESLFGSHKDITETLAQRVPIALVDTEQRREILGQKLRELYDIRSRLIHGEHVNAAMCDEYVHLAGQASRLGILWFLSVLDHYRGRPSKDGKERVPSQDDILRLLDLNKPKMRKTIDRFWKRLPEGFPHSKLS